MLKWDDMTKEQQELELSLIAWRRLLLTHHNIVGTRHAQLYNRHDNLVFSLYDYTGPQVVTDLASLCMSCESCITAWPSFDGPTVYVECAERRKQTPIYDEYTLPEVWECSMYQPGIKRRLAIYKERTTGR